MRGIEVINKPEASEIETGRPSFDEAIRVLLIDDQAIVGESVRRLLAHEPSITFRYCADPNQAIDQAKETKATVILQDLVMPDIDGLDVVRRFRACSEAARIPIIVLSTKEDPAIKSEAFAAGANDYLIKLPDKMELVARIRHHSSAYLNQIQRDEAYRALRESQQQLLESNKSLVALNATLEERTAALRTSEERFRSLSASSPIGIFQSDADGACLYTNQRWQEIAGLSLEQSLGDGWSQAIHPEDRETVFQEWCKTAREGGEFLRELRMLTPEGQLRWVHSRSKALRSEDGKLICHVGTVEDVTERKSLEAQLRQAQKLESIGQLAAGIAHEINTPTQYVSDNTRFLQDAFSDLMQVMKKYEQLLEASHAGPVPPNLVAEVEAAKETADLEFLVKEIPKAIQQSLGGTERVSKIVQSMKDFAYPGTNYKAAADLNKAIESTITVSGNEWKPVAEMVTDLDPNLPLIPCLLADLNQVFLNLIVNASQAIADAAAKSEGQKGTITVKTRQDGDWVEISVSDTGTGIPEAVRARIFDPFFTTKEVGKGTGQGLAISHSVIVTKHGGTIGFETQLGQGTTFRVRLPL